MEKAVQWGVASGCGVTGIIILIFLVVCSRSYKRRKKLLSESKNTQTSQRNSTHSNTHNFGNLQRGASDNRNSRHNKPQLNRLGSKNTKNTRSENKKTKQTDRNSGSANLTNVKEKSENIKNNARAKENNSFIHTRAEANINRDFPIFNRNVLFRDSHNFFTRSYHGNDERASFYSLQDFPMDRIRIPRPHLTPSGVQENLV